MKDYGGAMNSKEKLDSLSNRELIENLKAVCRKETEVTSELLLNLIEVDSRKLYLELGYSSLFSYLTEELRFSEPAAQRRISSARLIAKFPEAYELLLRREATLTTLSMTGRVISENNKDEMFEKIKGKSKREVEVMLAGYRPALEKRESVKPVVVRKETSSKKVCSPLFNLKQNSVNTAPSPEKVKEENETKEPLVEEQRYEFKFSVSKDVFHKYQEVQALLSGKYPKGAKIEELFDELLECCLDKKSPVRKAKRRERRLEKRNATRSPKNNSSTETQSRYIPKAIEEQVYIRDQGRCTFIGNNGKRCNSTHDLEFHHKKASARGGSHDVSNLTLHCRAHNALEARREFGT
jgi:5-methylcytosine-specific restriction endonuclease McrA